MGKKNVIINNTIVFKIQKKGYNTKINNQKRMFPVDITEQFIVLSQSNRSPPLTWIMNTLHKGEDGIKT